LGWFSTGAEAGTCFAFLCFCAITTPLDYFFGSSLALISGLGSSFFTSSTFFSSTFFSSTLTSSFFSSLGRSFYSVFYSLIKSRADLFSF